MVIAFCIKTESQPIRHEGVEAMVVRKKSHPKEDKSRAAAGASQVRLVDAETTYKL